MKTRKINTTYQNPTSSFPSQAMRVLNLTFNDHHFLKFIAYSPCLVKFKFTIFIFEKTKVLNKKYKKKTTVQWVLCIEENTGFTSAQLNKTDKQSVDELTWLYSTQQFINQTVQIFQVNYCKTKFTFIQIIRKLTLFIEALFRGRYK